MTDTYFEEHCPCGNSVKFSSGFSDKVKEQIQSWRSIHNRHANAIAKEMVKSFNFYPKITSTPKTYTAPYTVTLDVDTATGRTTKQE